MLTRSESVEKERRRRDRETETYRQPHRHTDRGIQIDRHICRHSN